MSDHKLILLQMRRTILEKWRSRYKRNYTKSVFGAKGKNIKTLTAFVKSDNLFYVITEFYTEKGGNENDL